MLKYFYIAIFIPIMGCQTIATRASYEEKLYEKNWRSAYELLEAIVSNNPSQENIDYATKEIQKDRNLLLYGEQLFSQDHLAFWQSRAGDLSIPKKRLDIYCAISGMNACNRAIAAIQATESSVKPRIYTIQRHYEKLERAHQERLSLSYDVKILSLDSVGKIVDRQSEDKSTQGSNAGSALGAAVASASYIDKSITASSFNYSARGHLAAQLAGAALGSALNKEENEMHRIRYTIKNLNGEFIYYDENSTSPIGQSIGVCFDIKRKVTVNDSLCDLDSNKYLMDLLKN